MNFSRADRLTFYQIFSVAIFMAGTVTANVQNSSVVPAVLIHNQQRAIIDTLKPFVQSGISEFLLCGDPSDGTIDIAQTYLESACRRVALDNRQDDNDGSYYTHICSTVKTKFPTAEFCLIYDGQWLAHNVNNLLEFCARVHKEQCPVYWVKLATHGVDEDSYTPSLIRCGNSVEFVGVINPVPARTMVEKVSSDIYFEWNRIQWGIINSKNMFTDDKEKLLHEYSKNPHDPHVVFSLAHIYETLNDLYTAYNFYMLRSGMQDNTEEDYLTSYRLAIILDKILKDKNDWSLQYRYLLQAHEARPWRAEPLVKIAQHYWREGNNQLAFLFAQQASQLKYPQQDTMAIEHQAYDYTPFDILGITGWYLQEFEIGESALRTALSIQPWDNHLTQNLDFYIKRKESLTNSDQKKDPRIPAGFGVDFHDSMRHGFAYNYDTVENDPFLKKLRKKK